VAERVTVFGIHRLAPIVGISRSTIGTFWSATGCP
jgi:hypothetical protein